MINFTFLLKITAITQTVEVETWYTWRTIKPTNKIQSNFQLSNSQPSAFCVPTVTWSEKKTQNILYIYIYIGHLHSGHFSYSHTIYYTAVTLLPTVQIIVDITHCYYVYCGMLLYFLEELVYISALILCTLNTQITHQFQCSPGRNIFNRWFTNNNWFTFCRYTPIHNISTYQITYSYIHQ